ncbi:RXT2-like protein [Astrocystis sublimbata]|nr:RXT2-like protein [Astrocystis sublimbata]
MVMASQQVVFAETIIAMKKARKRRAYESDSDSDVDNHGNRGNKLKKHARFAHEGQLAPPSGPEAYREIVNHAGYERAIICRNPPLIDDEGYEIDSDDDEDNILDAIANAAEFNPHANIRLENVLAPLTAITDLPKHQTFSRPYTSKTLTELTAQACNIMHKENAALWKVKHLQTKLIGDHDWAPCELMEGPNDIELFRDEFDNHPQESARLDDSIQTLDHAQTAQKPNGHSSTNGNGRLLNSDESQLDSDSTEKGDVAMTDIGALPDESTTSVDAGHPEARSTEQTSQVDGTGKETSSTARQMDRQSQRNGQSSDSVAANGGNLQDSLAPERAIAKSIARNDEIARKTTNEVTGPESVISDLMGDLPIHPMFLPPRSARPDRDLGIPESEAEDMRRMLQLIVQKQEEVCRGVKRLYEGLLRANRMRKTVFQWSKHEAHVGPNRDMSDGEDWYDKEEWNLEEDLKKGQDEEEDEPQTTKKTRNRR